MDPQPPDASDSASSMHSRPIQITTPATESSLVGSIAVGLVVVAAVVFTWLMWRMGQLAAPFVGDGFDQDGYTAAVGQGLGETATVLLAVSVVLWVAGCIMGIFAVATRSGRAEGVWAIVIGVLVPFVGFGAMFVTLWSLVP